LDLLHDETPRLLELCSTPHQQTEQSTTASQVGCSRNNDVVAVSGEREAHAQHQYNTAKAFAVSKLDLIFKVSENGSGSRLGGAHVQAPQNLSSNWLVIEAHR